MSSAEDESSISDKSYLNESEDAVSSKESDYDPTSGADFKNVHQVITEERRKQLVSLIIDHGHTIAKASRKVGLMYSTAKTIYGKYRKDAKPNTNKNFKEAKSRPMQFRAGRPQRSTRSITKREDESYKQEQAKPAKTLCKAEESKRMEAPTTRKRVKLTNGNSKESHVCKVKDPSKANSIKSLVHSPTRSVKDVESKAQSETDQEAPLIFATNKPAVNQGLANPVINTAFRSQLEVVLENYNRQTILSQIALAKAMLAGSVLNLTQPSFGQGFLPPQSYANNIPLRNYLLRQSSLQPNFTQLPQSFN